MLSKKLKKGKPNNWGGVRTGAGRPFEGKETQKVKIPKYAHTKIKGHLQMLSKKGGQSTSMQEYCSKIVVAAAGASEDSGWLKTVSREITSGTAPWCTLTLTAEAYCHLEILTKQIATLSPVYTNLSNCFTVILLKHVAQDALRLKILGSRARKTSLNDD